MTDPSVPLVQSFSASVIFFVFVRIPGPLVAVLGADPQLRRPAVDVVGCERRRVGEIVRVQDVVLESARLGAALLRLALVLAQDRVVRVLPTARHRQRKLQTQARPVKIQNASLLIEHRTVI